MEAQLHPHSSSPNKQCVGFEGEMGGDHLCYWESICMSGLVSQMYLFFFCCKKMGSRKYTCVYVCAHMCAFGCESRLLLHFGAPEFTPGHGGFFHIGMDLCRPAAQSQHTTQSFPEWLGDSHPLPVIPISNSSLTS